MSTRFVIITSVNWVGKPTAAHFTKLMLGISNSEALSIRPNSLSKAISQREHIKHHVTLGSEFMNDTVDL